MRRACPHAARLEVEMQRDWEAGRLVGRYMVHRCIAAGGMATVHLGRLLGAAGFARTVAIKRLHDGYARDPEFVAMLLDEARLASTIRHPNVVPTLDVVAEQDELLVVMEYVEGDSLASLSRLALAAREAFPVAHAASVVAQALHGLHAAHEARDKNGAALGIVHRDVSPQNVLLGVDGVARVLDFGIAKAASRATSTEDGQLKGKAAYMAPEQLQHGVVDRRTDVFAAAVIFWELLAGRRLFLADSPAQTMSRVLHDPVDSPQRWAAAVPTELALIALRGLERDPDGRFASAEEMALAIEDAVALPRAKDVGDWVARVAAPTLARRAELVREVERASNPIRAASTTDPTLRAALEEAERRRQRVDMPTDVGQGAHGSAAAPAGWAMAASTGAPIVQGHAHALGPVGEELTDLATVKSSASFLVAPPRRGPSAAVIAAIAGGAALLTLALVVGLLAVRGRDAEARGATEPPATAEAPDAPAAGDAPSAGEAAGEAAGQAAGEAAGQAAGEAESEAESEAAAGEAAVGKAAASGTAAASRKATTPKARKRRAPPRAKGKADCRIPYVVDDKGLKHFKVECL